MVSHERLLGRVGQQSPEQASSDEESGDHQYWSSAVRLHQVAEHQVPHNGPQPGGHQGHCHGSRPERRREELNAQAVKTVETHRGDSAEDAGENEVHGGAIDQIDEEGRGSTEEHRETEEELPAELVHVEYGPDIGWGCRQGDDEAVDEDLIVRDAGGAVRSQILGCVQLDLQVDDLTM